MPGSRHPPAPVTATGKSSNASPSQHVATIQVFGKQLVSSAHILEHSIVVLPSLLVDGFLQSNVIAAFKKQGQLSFDE
jgi:hypothetical protein